MKQASGDDVPLMQPTTLPLLSGAILLLFSVFLLWRAHVVSALLRALPGLLLMFCALILMLGSLDIMTYRQLLREESVATVHFEQLGVQTYGVKLIDADNREYYFQLKGDQWQIDARIIRWHPNLSRLGFQPLYRLERIAGRYTDISQELHQPRTVHPILISSYGLDAWQWFKQFQWLNQWVDAAYGSATFLPMANGASYEIKVGYGGMVARPVNAIGRRAVSSWQ